MSTEWDPTQFFCDSSQPIAPFALLVLNQPINERAFAVLKKHDSVQHRPELTDGNQLPNLIIGDLDSIRPSVRSHYEGLGVSVIKDPDQYSTDFTKCLKYLRAHAAEIITKRVISTQSRSARLEILIMGGLGGRVDQALSQIHHLYMMTREVAGESAAGDLYLISEESITFLLQSGRHTIRTPRTNRPGVCPEQGEDEYYLLEENVGIIPLSGPARITTRGFQWDVEDWLTEIGGQLSTSNHIRADEVMVETGVPVLFTLELAERFKRMR
ncbi:thiamine pyrophosphokinase [Aspergillus fumigatus]|uniref:Thiamine pyrophosphokinase n=2 Tax=Aspergillus fumigatus TaxID=746128 RepID=Q4WGL1_ASPFU|nr:thiamine pyrophosphokinase Thi80, putative [Aspergillus fumigatus Af293]EAL86930.1 thiamine pyrophosphokinase Thi80, putative [Aspergillus fumigatus Af293]EDP48382.1 thiamine pyrophosphokinase, putative [Aspergillus fumigatus A1163]